MKIVIIISVWRTDIIRGVYAPHVVNAVKNVANRKVFQMRSQEPIKILATGVRYIP